MDWLWQGALILAIGFASGVLNALAGGGSLLTLPLLIFLGLPPAVANGTNRVALIMQNVAAVEGFRRRGVFPKQLMLLCTPAALVGSVIGARLAVGIDGELFKKILAGIMIGVVVLILLDPARRLRLQERALGVGQKLALSLAFFAVGLYSGFVQAGVGFTIITTLLLFGIDLVRINAVKVFVVLLCMVPALAVFAGYGEVDWLLGLVLGIGNAAGGWYGARLAVDKGHAWIKRVVVVTVVLFAIKLLLG